MTRRLGLAGLALSACALALGASRAAEALQPAPPQPVLGETAVVEPVRGVVRIRLPGEARFGALTGPAELPEGGEIDARRGRMRLTVARDRSGATDSALFYLGRFRFFQSATREPYTTLTLIGGRFPRNCGKTNPKLRVPIAEAAATRRSRRRVIRRLWGDGKGRFRTKGRYASATVRGTKWQTIDRCDGVALEVERGIVDFRDLLRATPSRRVRAGETDFVPSARRRQP